MRPATLVYNLHCRVCGVPLSSVRSVAANTCATCREFDRAPSWWQRFRALEPPTARGLGAALAFLVMLLGALLIFVTWAAASDWELVVTPQGIGEYFFVDSPAFSVNDAGHVVALNPGSDTTLGSPEHLWRSVQAESFVANGQPGLNTVIHLAGCTITIQGGLIVSAVQQQPFNQPCP